MPRARAGFVVWLTGLPAAGKTTLGVGVAAELAARELVVEHLDGDLVRTHLSRGLGYTQADRETNVARIAWVASRIARAGAATIVSAISPYADGRSAARALIEQEAPFVEIHVATPLLECIRRDPKGLYVRAYAGELENFTGVSAPYEEPRHPELRLDTTGSSPAESSRAVWQCLVELGLVPARSA